MSASGETLCITCGLAAGDPPQLNHLASGELCPTCHARFLDAQPALVPGFSHSTAEEAETVDETVEEGETEGRPVQFELVSRPEPPAATGEA